jgi:hypothetical protein
MSATIQNILRHMINKLNPKYQFKFKINLIIQSKKEKNKFPFAKN